MAEVIFFVVGAILGGLATWALVTARARAAGAREQARLQSELAAASSTVNELREQVRRREQSVESLRREIDAERQTRVTAETRLQETEKRLQEERQLLAEAEKKLKETFEALSAKALQANAEQFLAAAKKTLETVLVDTKGNLGKHQEAINGLIKPLAEALKRLDEQNRTMEQVRQKAYGSLEEQVKMLTVTGQQLQQETGKLVTSLRSPKVRGRWGEIALRRAAELAGMIEHCDFEEQAQLVVDDDARYRPDMLVHLPGGRTVVVDAKTVLDAYLDAVGAADDEQRQQHLSRHAEQVRNRVRELSSKAYWDKLGCTPEFVVLFLPGESFFSAAVEIDPPLIEDAIQKRVVLASPTTLISLLKAIAYGWRQEQIAENAEQISRLGKELYERIDKLVDYLARIGGGLNTAVMAYNRAVGSLETRVLPTARKFKELGAAPGEEIPLLEPIENTPKELESSGGEDSTSAG